MNKEVKILSKEEYLVKRFMELPVSIITYEEISHAKVYINELQQKNQQLKEQIIKLKLSNKYKNILYDLKEWLEIEKVVTMDTMKRFAFSDVLSKLNELEEENNE